MQPEPHTTRGNVQKAIKDACSEEILRQKIAEQECYTELVEIILAAVTELSDTCNLTTNHEEKIEKINEMIIFMWDKGMKLGCKTLTRETGFSDFLTAGNDTETMISARDIVNTTMQLMNSSNSGKKSRMKKIGSETKLSKENY